MRVAVADDVLFTRDGLVRHLEAIGAEVTAEAASGPELLAKLGSHLPDVVVLDIVMPRGTEGGLDTAERLRRLHPNVGILMLSAYREMSYAVRLFANGETGLGYLLKDEVRDLEKLRQALETLAAGGTVMDVGIITLLMEHRRKSGELDKLTSRERDVLAEMAQGAANATIAQRLHIDRKTVESHVSNIFSKLGLSQASDDKRVLAVLAWLRVNR